MTPKPNKRLGSFFSQWRFSCFLYLIISSARCWRPNDILAIFCESARGTTRPLTGGANPHTHTHTHTHTCQGTRRNWWNIESSTPSAAMHRESRSVPTAWCCHLAHLTTSSKSHFPSMLKVSSFHDNSCDCFQVILLTSKPIIAPVRHTVPTITIR